MSEEKMPTGETMQATPENIKSMLSALKPGQREYLDQAINKKGSDLDTVTANIGAWVREGEESTLVKLLAEFNELGLDFSTFSPKERETRDAAKYLAEQIVGCLD